jgi:serine/threonine-protein kinase
MITATQRLLVAVSCLLVIFAACTDSNPPSGANSEPQSVAAQSASQSAAPTHVASPAANLSAPPVSEPAAPVAKDPYAAAKAAGATAVCADGTWSYSKNRSGTCSHHGGVHWWTGNLGPAGPGAH